MGTDAFVRPAAQRYRAAGFDLSRTPISPKTGNCSTRQHVFLDLGNSIASFYCVTLQFFDLQAVHKYLWLKILPVSDCSPRYCATFPANSMIPIHRCKGG